MTTPREYRALKVILIGLIVIFCILFCYTRCHAQIKKHIAPAVMVFTSGACEGVMDYLQFKYEGNSQYWQPDISWKNKWKNGDRSQGEKFFGSSTIFVWTTDGWHLMKFGRNLSMFSGFALILNMNLSGDNRKKWYWYIIEGAAYWTINRLGFNFTYKLLQLND